MKERYFSLLDVDRFWIIWISCLEKPRCLEEIAQHWKYKTPTALYHKYKGVLLADWMVENGYLKFCGKDGKRKMYLALIDNFVGGDKEDIKFWHSEWIRSSLFNLQHIKTLFRAEEHGYDFIGKLGHDFYPFVFTYVMSVGTEMASESWLRNERKMSKPWIKILECALVLCYMLLDVESYVKVTKPALLHHKKEVLKFCFRKKEY